VQHSLALLIKEISLVNFVKVKVKFGCLVFVVFDGSPEFIVLRAFKFRGCDMDLSF